MLACKEGEERNSAIIREMTHVEEERGGRGRILFPQSQNSQLPLSVNAILFYGAHPHPSPPLSLSL